LGEQSYSCGHESSRTLNVVVVVDDDDDDDDDDT